MNALGNFAPLSGRRLAPLLALGLAQSLAAAAQVYLVARVVDGIHGDGPAPLRELAALAVFLAAETFARRAELVRAEALGQEVVRDLRVGIFGRTLELADPRLGDLRRGGIVLRFLGDLTPLRRWIALAYVRLPIAGLTLAAGSAVLATHGLGLVLAVMAPLLVAGAVAQRLSRPLERELGRRRKHKNLLAAGVAQRVGALEAVRAAARESRERARVHRECERLRVASLRVHVRKQNVRVALQAGLAAATLLVLAFAATAQGSTPGELVSALALLGTMAPALTSFSELLELRPELRLTQRRLDALFHLPVRRAAAEPDPAAPMLQVLPDLPGEALVLQPIGKGSEGRLVGLRGGAAKDRRRWMAALAGLEAPPSGAIALAGVPAQHLSPKARRRLLAYARADLQLVPGTVSKNIRYRARRSSERSMERALALAGLPDVDVALLGRRSDGDGRDFEPELRNAIRIAQAIVDRPPLILLDGLNALLPAQHQAALLNHLRHAGCTVVVADWDPACDALMDLHWTVPPMTQRASTSTSRAPWTAGAAIALIAAALAPTHAFGLQDEDVETMPEGERPEGWEFRFGSRGLELLQREQDLLFRLGGRIHLDAGFFSGDNPRPDPDVELRRARLSFAARLGRDWRASASYDFGPTEGLRTLWLRWQGARRWHVTGGAQITPFGMDEQTSSNQLVFMERSLASALSPGQLLGVSASWRKDDVAASFGVFENNLENEPKRRSEGYGVVGRATAVPLRQDEHLVHVGASVELRDVDADSRYRIRSRPETALGDVRLVNTGTISGVASTRTGGLELGWRAHQVVVQGEWIASQLDVPGEDPTLWGAYGQVSTFLSDHRRRYDTRRGAFGTPNLDPWEHALEIGARLSRLDLEDAGVTGGISTDLTLGATWYFGPNMRVLGNVVFAFADPDRDGAERELQVYQMRFQWNF